ncbi:hypothetical protein IEO70_16820 [Bacillus sp. AGMB 02131]|uniref:Regulatory protein YycH domain-containing protein n=1 Tax=Peribacillus faecalis TaxID=2772559 RepID=A0A927D1T6_9BACI|nr:two-component system activity regulator YycH [Peribacillus faecalis]MBD3110005.1 hypothetical protein [Peribacillus faecalis]
MSKEGLKSIFLTALVILSLFLTWNIWTYSPNFDEINQPQYMEDVTISNKQEIASIVQPVQILYHFDGKHYGSSSESVLGDVMNLVTSWSFSNFEDLSLEYSSQELQNIIKKNGSNEILFADEVPLLLYKKVINIEDRELPDVEFDRILIRAISDNSTFSPVYFINTSAESVYRMNTETSNVKELAEAIGAVYETFQPFSLIEVTEGKSFYLPSTELKINGYKYYTELLDEREFRDALFEDPKLVRQTPTSRGKEYTDGLREMTVNTDIMMLNYIVPSKKESVKVPSSDLLNRSIQFVNEHAGWEENYRFAEMDTDKQEVIFRLYTDGLPVFNSAGMSEIIQVWTQEEIYSYDRPFFTMNFPVPPGTKEVTVPSGEKAVEQLLSLKDFQVNLLEGLAIGYGMTRDSTDSRLITLEPAWHYKYNGVWRALMPTAVEGVTDGLE